MKCISGSDLIKFISDQKEIVKYIGDFDKEIYGFCSLNNPRSCCLLWLKHPNEDSLKLLNGFKNNVIITPEVLEPFLECESFRFIVTDQPKKLFFKVLKKFWSSSKKIGLDNTSVILTKKIGKNVSIGANCFIDEDVVIGDGTVIESNVSLLNFVDLGSNCIVHSGAVVGADGFGYYLDEGIPQKIEHFGGVIVGNEVEIGANTCIDRGTIDNTCIGSGSKIDNLCHIGHNVILKENVMITANSVIGGSSKLENDSYLAPGSIVKNQLTIGKNAFVGMGAVVTKSVDDNTVVAGVPAKELRKVKNGDK